MIFIAIQTTEFNSVFQLGHIMNHLFSWGIGFQQLVDYYYKAIIIVGRVYQGGSILYADYYDYSVFSHQKR